MTRLGRSYLHGMSGACSSSRVLSGALASLVFFFAGEAPAQAAAPSPALPPIHPLGAAEHASRELLGAVSAVRALPGGRVLVNDINGRKVVLFDSTLSQFTVVADTTSATANAYSSRAAGLIRYKGDSTLFVDPTSLSMLVIDGAGKVGRVMSVPRANHAGALIGGPNGTPGFDGHGRLVYRAPPEFRPPDRGADGAFTLPKFPDSAAVVRIDLASRKLDTVAFVKTPKININMSQDANGRMTVTTTINPMPVTDDWAVLADGSVAIVRGRDYHVELVREEGGVQPAPKLPFAWRHLDDSSKTAFIDSTKSAMEKLRAEANAQRAANGGNGPVVLGPPEGGGAAGGMVVMQMGGDRAARGGGDGGRAARGQNNGAGGPNAGGNLGIPPLQFVSPSELPDYAPPFTPGSARGDWDGNLWVRTSNTMNGGSVYDVISAKGELLDRVLMPAGRVIAGFGPGGVVYMGVREGTGTRLEQGRRK